VFNGCLANNSNTYPLSRWTIDHWVINRVANGFQNGCLSSIASADDEDAKVLAAFPELDCFVHAVRGAVWRERDNRLIAQMKLKVCTEGRR
jgi:hypothetical protein